MGPYILFNLRLLLEVHRGRNKEELCMMLNQLGELTFGGKDATKKAEGGIFGRDCQFLTFKGPDTNIFVIQQILLRTRYR